MVVIAHRGGQYFVDKYSVDKKHFASDNPKDNRTHNAQQLFSLRQVHSGKKIFKKICRRAFWLKP